MTDNSREGWIEWSGGPNPVPGRCVDYKNRCGGFGEALSETLGGWVHGTHLNDPSFDIIAYRIVTAADDRGDGNEGRQPVVSKSSTDELAIAVEPGELIARLRAADYHDPACPFDRHCLCGDDGDPPPHDRITHPDGPEAADLIERLTARLASQQETIRADGEALKPFARYLDVLDTMGGNTPRSGVYCGVTSSVAGEAEITIEDMQAARARLSARQGGGDAILNEGQT